jgi:hypothetical protein
MHGHTCGCFCCHLLVAVCPVTLSKPSSSNLVREYMCYNVPVIINCTPTIKCCLHRQLDVAMQRQLHGSPACLEATM